MQPRLLILSDLFGGKNPEWVNYYIEELELKFEIQYYDVKELGEIDSDIISEEDIHNQFVKSGIEKAVQNLLELEKGNVTVLGFSIGGTIAWKAALNGLKVTRLFAISSTRLRYETEVPDCEIRLYFGEKDTYKPASNSFLNLNVESIIVKNQGHQLYLEEENRRLICYEILKR